MGKRLDVRQGDRFGRFTIITEVGKRSEKRYFLCKCDCGETRIERLVALRAGETKSCGCLKHETDMENARKCYSSHPNFSDHNSYYQKMYGNWHDMKQRCQNPNSVAFKWYGERGITVCEEWHKFKPFMEWALRNEWEEGLTIERKDVNGNYEPSNCTWIPKCEQINNTRRSRMLTFMDRTQNLTQWRRELGFNRGIVEKRLMNGWSVERALTTPSGEGRKCNAS